MAERVELWKALQNIEAGRYPEPPMFLKPGDEFKVFVSENEDLVTIEDKSRHRCASSYRLISGSAVRISPADERKEK